MKDSQAEPVKDGEKEELVAIDDSPAATEGPAATEDGQAESAEDSQTELAEETRAEAGPSDVTHGGPAETASAEDEPTTGAAGVDEPLADDLKEGSDKPLAAPAPQPDRHPADGPTAHLVVFALGDEQYGLDIDAVDSIIRLQPVTAVPRAPGFVEGLTNLRGTVLPVVDLHKRFGLPARDTTKDTRIIVAEAAGNKVGMRVDAVLEVRRVPQAAVEPPSPLVATVDSAFVTGVAKVEEDRLVILLDLERVLAT
jgi:purine-binding chemotaxis protein CheW